MTGIKALARQLHLSIGTVSRALNARPDVSAQTRERVLEAARQAGYRPNHSGRSLRNGRTNTVGMVIETGNASTLGGDTFFAHLIDAMQETLGATPYDLILLPCRSADDPLEFLGRQIARRSVDALVITATRRQDPRIDLLTSSGLPFLALGRSETPGDFPWIDLDFEGAARRSVEALVRLGHRRIAIAAPRQDVNLAQVYIGGYRAALTAAGLPFDDRLVLRASASENGGLEVAGAILEMSPRPSAVLLAQELMAIGVYSGLAQEGLVPGHHLSVIGVRHNRQLQFLSPELSAFALDLRGLGRAVGEAVVALVEAPQAGPGHLVWPLDFVPTGSIGPPPD